MKVKISKTHFVSVKEETKNWPVPRKVQLLCGEEMEDAMPVVNIDPQNLQLAAAKTLTYCGGCLAKVLELISQYDSEFTYLYGCLPEAQARIVNQEEE